MRILSTLILCLVLVLPGLAASRPLDLSPEEKAWLADHKDSLVLGYDPKFPPLEFQNPAGEFSGMSADLVATLEKLLDVRFQKRPQSVWTNVLNGLRDGSLALTPAIVSTEERREYAIFTPPYASIPLVIITSKAFTDHTSLEELAGRRVAVVRDYSSADLVRRESGEKCEIVEVDNIQEGLRDVSFGVVDAFVESVAVAAWFIDQEGLANLRVAGDVGAHDELSIGVSARYPLLASAVTKALASIPPDDIRTMTTRWIKLETSLFDAQTLRTLRFAGALTLVLLILLGGATWGLSRTLRQKLLDLEQTKANLADQVERFRLALDATNAGAWEYHPAQGREEHSLEWYTMLGYKPQYGPYTLDSWLDLVHPDDRAQAAKAFSDYVQGDGHGIYEAEYRMRASDDSWRWVLGKGRAVSWDESGQPTRIIGLNLDIQQMKSAQEEVLRTQALVRALLEQTTQFTGLLDLDGNLLLANRTALDWAKARAEDVLNRPFWDGPWWPDRAEAEGFIRQTCIAVRTGRTVHREIAHVAPDGTVTPFDFTASPFRDDSGQVVSIVVEARDISIHKKDQQAVVESERRFRTIFENAPYSIVINRLADGKYMDANPACLTRLGLDRDTLLTKTFNDIGPLPPEHQRLVEEAIARGHGVNNLETSILRPDGSVGHILYSGTGITIDGEPCILSLPVDITELKNTQEELRKSQEMFARLFHLSPDMIALARQDDGSLLEINEAFTRFTGLSRDEAMGRTTLALGIFREPAKREEFAATLLRDGVIENFEFDILHRDGRVLHCAASARLLDMGETPCILSITRDITHFRAMQDVMVQSEKMLSLGGIAAGIAHEINNPLGIILQATQTINLRLSPGHAKNQETALALGLDLERVEAYLKARKINEFMVDIEEAGIRAAGIIRHMLDFSRKSESRRALCDVPRIVEQALALAGSDYDLKKNYDFKTVTIVREFEANLPAIPCTETEIEQVLLNLLRNAAQAMAETGTPNPTIRIAAATTAGGVRIEIEDNGPGIPEDHRKRVFEPFFTTKEPGKGTGLGLSVSYFIITKGHGGRMSVTPGERGGTLFRIDLPGDKNPLATPVI